MKLHIITPQSKQTFVITWLELHTGVGNFVIQPGHAPMIVTLMPKQPIIFMLAGGKQKSLIINKGVVEITRSTATALIDEIV